MKTASLKEIKYELSTLSQKELMELCLRMSKYKKENKELLTYLLFEADDEAAYVESVKRMMDEQFAEVNLNSFYFATKNVRKILRLVKKYIRYSKNKESEVELMIYFCASLNQLKQPLGRSIVLQNIVRRQVVSIRKAILRLHEDLQYDYNLELDQIEEDI